MLQPLQLKDVSARYAGEMAELRDFFAKSGLPLNTPQSLRTVADQLEDSRTFRRDLTSHLFLLLYNGTHHPSTPDLLGIVAVAAAGPSLAAAAADADAHDLLRFLVQTRHAFDAVPGTLPPAISQRERSIAAPPVFVEPLDTHELFRSSVGDEDRDGISLNPRAVIGAAAFALLALLVGLGLHFHNTPQPTSPLVASAPPAAPSPAAAPAAAPAPVPHAPSAPHSTAAALPPYSPVAETPLAPAAGWKKPSPATPMPAPTHAVASIRTLPASRPANSALTRNSGASAPVPLVLSARAVPRATAGSVTGTTTAPIVRTGAGSISRPPAQPVVRPTSVGIMAANVVYSPVPVYPAAASAAHVQGEVKLEAEVGRDGSVVSTRVISGPPQLRDAAASALQRWLYRPYLYEGKPVAMNASVIMDFQLPSL